MAQATEGAEKSFARTMRCVIVASLDRKARAMQHAGQARDEPGIFDAKGRVDRLVRLACGHAASCA